MPLHGDVKTFSLGAIVRMINAEVKTGVLKVTGDGRQSLIYFKDGKIVFTSGYRAKELRLGALLKENNLITEEKLQEMLKIAKVVEKRLGMILLERGYISKENLVRILSHQVREAVGEAMTWGDAEFVYKEGLDGYVDDLQFEVDPKRLVNEAEHWGRYRKIIPNDDAVFQIRPGALQSKSVYAGPALRILLLIDGKRTVAQIIAETGYSRLAVYRALASLLAAEAIARPKDMHQESEPEPLPMVTILAFYLRLLQTITADLTGELGGKKARASVEVSLGHLRAREEFLLAIGSNQDLSEGVRKVRAVLQQENLSRKELLQGLNKAVLALLGEENRLLGSKATMSTLRLLQQVLDDLPSNQQALGRAMKRFLGHQESKLSPGASVKAPPGITPAEELAAEQPGSALDLESAGGSAIITFFGQMVQVILSDLESVLGAKAQELFQNTLKNSKYYKNFLSQFSPQSNGSANAVRMREYMKSRELKLSKQELLQAFSEVILILLREESGLLGIKAAQQTIARLTEAMTRTDTKYQPLKDHLAALLATHTGGWR
jgi:predicted transcriptional regulator